MVWLRKDELTPSIVSFFRKELTIVPRKAWGYDDVPAEPIRCYQETPFEIGVPRAFWFGTATKEYEYDWDVWFGHDWQDPPECLLRHEGNYAEQGKVVSLFADRFLRASPQCPESEEPSDREAGMLMGGVFQAATGAGKTATTLSLIHQLQTSALVVVHKDFLLTQWVEQAEKWLPGVRVGVVREKKCDFEDKHIVVAMAQSLALETGDRYPKELYDWPGLLVFDECHRVSAPTWAPTPPKFSAAWRLGLTATPRRKDGADNVFWWHIGPIAYKAKTETPKPSVRMVKVKPSVPDVARRDDVKAPLVINILARLKRRNQVLVAEMVKALKAPAKRKLFVLSERLEHLRLLESLLREAWEAQGGGELTTGFYTGEWFTGEVKPKLAHRTWPMKDGGRERAIEAIYRSMARKWSSFFDLSPLGEEVVEELKPRVITNEETKEKVHSLVLKWGDMAAIQGIVTDSAEDREPVHVVLEDLEDRHLYEMASYFNISQKKMEKKRRQTREELREAERARVIFATYQMTAEGVDIPAVDTEFLVTPIADVEQAVGRVRRFCLPEQEKCAHLCPWRAGECQGKPGPIVCDLVDVGIPLASRRERYRREFYESLGATVAG